jgi:hypothetical protein
MASHQIQKQDSEELPIIIIPTPGMRIRRKSGTQFAGGDSWYTTGVVLLTPNSEACQSRFPCAQGAQVTGYHRMQQQKDGRIERRVWREGDLGNRRHDSMVEGQ